MLRVFYVGAPAPPSKQREPAAGTDALTSMHCWEFHHRIDGGSYQWYWKALTAEGHLHAQSARSFATFLQALDDAQKNGFNRELHEWYLATPTASPCLKTVDDPPRPAKGDGK